MPPLGRATVLALVHFSAVVVASATPEIIERVTALNSKIVRRNFKGDSKRGLRGMDVAGGLVVNAEGVTSDSKYK